MVLFHSSLYPLSYPFKTLNDLGKNVKTRIRSQLSVLIGEPNKLSPKLGLPIGRISQIMKENSNLLKVCSVHFVFTGAITSILSIFDDFRSKMAPIIWGLIRH